MGGARRRLAWHRSARCSRSCSPGLLFRNVDPVDEDAWEGVALDKTAELLTAHGEDAAQTMADLWQLDVERERALRNSAGHADA